LVKHKGQKIKLVLADTFDAATREVGDSLRTSLAKEGPDTNTAGCLRPKASGMISDIIIPVLRSNPLLAAMMGTCAGSRSCKPTFHEIRTQHLHLDSFLLPSYPISLPDIPEQPCPETSCLPLSPVISAPDTKTPSFVIHTYRPPFLHPPPPFSLPLSPFLPLYPLSPSPHTVIRMYEGGHPGAHVHACVHSVTYVRGYLCVCECLCVCACVCVRVCECVCMGVRVCVCVCVCECE
jgi:hypothetical protein